MIKNIFIFLLLLGAGLGCGRKSADPETGTMGQQSRTAVKADVVEKVPIAETVRFNGEIYPFSEVQIFPKVSGIITQEYVVVGQIVKKDQVLAELIQDIPGMEYSPVKIAATIAGYVTLDAVEIGSRIGVQQVAYQISQLSRVNVKAKIGESVLGRIKTGDPVVVRVEAYPDESFHGRIAELSPLVDRASRTGEAKITLANPELRLKPGMFASITMTIGKQNSLIVPLDAVVFSGMNPYIFAIKNNLVEQVSVQTGTIVDQKIVITGSIQAGDSVVVFGQNLLVDGAAVRVIEGY